MSLTLDRLGQQCQQRLKPFYVVTTDELYLADQAVKTLCKAAKQQGFDETQRFHLDNVKDWPPTWQAIHTQSLLSDKRIVIIRATIKALNKTAQQQIQEYCAACDANVLVVLVLPKLKSNQLNQAWVKTVEKVGEVVTAWPISREQLPNWISTRCQQYGMRITPTASRWLADNIEGDAGLAAQEVEKLYCLYGLPAKANGESVTIDETHLRDTIVDAARFDVYGLTDACLSGDFERGQRILNTLKSQTSELTLINWALARLLRQLLALHQAGPQGFAQTCQSQGIWKKQQSQFQQACQRLSHANCLDALLACQRLDESIKGLGERDPWQWVEEICAKLCGLAIIEV